VSEHCCKHCAQWGPLPFHTHGLDGKETWAGREVSPRLFQWDSPLCRSSTADLLCRFPLTTFFFLEIKKTDLPKLLRMS
jgi:hypothetical protein